MTMEGPNRCGKMRSRRGGDTEPHRVEALDCAGGRARCPHRPIWNVAILCSLLIGAWSLSAAPALTDLQCYPTNINLSSAKSIQRLTVQAIYADGITREVTTQASLKLANSKIVRLDHGTLSPLADGQTDLRVSYKGRKLSVPIAVSNAPNQPAISFKLDVMPVFM